MAEHCVLHSESAELYRGAEFARVKIFYDSGYRIFAVVFFCTVFFKSRLALGLQRGGIYKCGILNEKYNRIFATYGIKK